MSWSRSTDLPRFVPCHAPLPLTKPPCLECPALQGEAEEPSGEPSAPLEGTGGLTQFELLEASAPTQAPQGGPLSDSLNRQTLAFVG